VRWVQELAGIDFRIYYRPGTQNSKPNALSRHTEYCPEKGGIENQLIMTVLQEKHLDKESLNERRSTTFICSSARITSLPTRKWNEGFLKKVQKEGRKDASYQEAMEAILKEERCMDRKAGNETLEAKDKLLYRKGMLWVPEGMVQKILESEHDTRVAEHMGQDKTIELIQRNFWWPKMNERIIDFIRSCPNCQKNKASRHQPYGLSSPLELPYTPWQSIAMDFITELPISDSCDQLWVIINRFTKMAHLLPLRKEGKSAADLAVIFAREVWKYHGLPTDIVSYRDSRFISETWKEFLRLSGIRP